MAVSPTSITAFFSGLYFGVDLSTARELLLLTFAVALPLLQTWVVIELFFLIGTDGPNRFGPDPLARVATARSRGLASGSAQRSGFSRAPRWATYVVDRRRRFHMDWNWYLFRFNGRINRARMWLSVLIILCWMIFLGVLTIASGIVSGGKETSFGFSIDDIFRVIDPASYRSLSWAYVPTLADQGDRDFAVRMGLFRDLDQAAA